MGFLFEAGVFKDRCIVGGSLSRWEKLSTLHHLSEGLWSRNILFTYGFTTFIREKFIDSYSLGLRQIAAKVYRSAERN
jgi:hypothetical protein